jgi:hypothetical protein
MMVGVCTGEGGRLTLETISTKRFGMQWRMINFQRKEVLCIFVSDCMAEYPGVAGIKLFPVLHSLSYSY